MSYHRRSKNIQPKTGGKWFMSRSKKRNYYAKDKNNKYMKKLSNSKVRKSDIDYLPPKGKSYKKLMCSWDICDYKSRWTLEEAITYYNKKVSENDEWFLEHYPTLEDYLKYYKRCVVYK